MAKLSTPHPTTQIEATSTLPQKSKVGKGFERVAPMPGRSVPQRSFFSPEFADPGCLVSGTLPWLLAHYGSTLLPSWLFEGWSVKGGRGRDPWPASVLLAMVLMRWNEEGMSRRASVRQAAHHTTWRAAMGLPIGGRTPSERTLRRFEKFLRQRHSSGTVRHVLLHEHWVRLCLEKGVGNSERSVWAMDSTPMWAYGAVLDTVRLLGDGLRMLASEWAHCTDASLAELATEWRVPFILGKSTKGGLAIDWRDKEARADALDALAQDVVRVTTTVREQLSCVGAAQRKILQRCRHLLRVVRDDLETDEQGRLVIARRVAKNRIVSMTDPQSRHSRKSKSKPFTGFKVHILGDVVSGLIASVAVTPANVHDSVPANRLIKRAKQLCNEIETVLGDTAYGGAELRVTVRGTTGVVLRSPPPPVTLKDGRIGRQSIAIDFEADTATCAQGFEAQTRSSTWSKEHKVRIPVFKWPAVVCNACPRRAACRGKQAGGHKILLHPFESELRAARQDWQDPDVRDQYRTRSQCERLIHQMTRHGARQARA